MPLEASYAIWNSRACSGKTSLTYELAHSYCTRNPDKTTVIIDMSGQASVSRLLLGNDNSDNDIVNQLLSMQKDPIMLDGNQRIPKTVSGYLDVSCSAAMPKNIDPRNFLLNVSKINSKHPRNLYLLCGDPSLELLSKVLEMKRNSQMASPSLDMWKTVTLSLRYFIQKVSARRGIKLMVFIDTGNSFGICTEIALAASERIIIPIYNLKQDQFTFDLILSQLYGITTSNHFFYYYRHLSFFCRAYEFGIKLPKIYLIVYNNHNINYNNNSNRNDGIVSSDMTRWNFLHRQCKENPHVFEAYDELSNKSTEDFLRNYVIFTTTQLVDGPYGHPKSGHIDFTNEIFCKEVANIIVSRL